MKTGPHSYTDPFVFWIEGELEIFRFARRYVQSDYRVKSLRCKTCKHIETCEGLHVNHVRAFGFAALQPVTDG